MVYQHWFQVHVACTIVVSNDHKAWGSSAFQQAVWLPGTTSTLTSRLISVFNCHKFSTLRIEGNLLRQRKIFSKIKRKKFANAKSLLTLLQEFFFWNYLGTFVPIAMQNPSRFFIICCTRWNSCRLASTRLKNSDDPRAIFKKNCCSLWRTNYCARFEFIKLISTQNKCETS